MITNAKEKIAEIEIMIAIEIEAGVMVIEIAAVMTGTEVADLLLGRFYKFRHEKSLSWGEGVRKSRSERG